MKKLIWIFAMLFTFAAGNAFAALSSTFSLPANTSVTMGDSSATMPFLVANTGDVAIKSVQFVVNTAVYNIGAATTAPSGWSLTIAAGSVCFTNSSAPIAPGSSQVFNVVLTGPSGGAIASASSDQTDSLAGSSGASNSANCTGVVAPTTSDSWTRKSLAVNLSATPSSVGTGDTITLTMQVTNRSSATQSSIVASPAPPSAYLYGLTNLSGYHNSNTTTITVASTTDFPSSGTIRIDNEEISYTGKTATTFTGCTRGVNGTTTSFHPDGVSVYNRTSTAAVSNSGGPTPASLSLNAGDSSTITWTYTANSTASIYFSASAGNGSATSKKENSNQVVIGDFTAVVSIDPLSVVSGQTITVTMVVSNNGTSSIGNITPTLNTGGTATKTPVSGPTPTSIASIGAGQSGTFTWTYTISGTSGQTYFFSGYATTASGGGATTNTSTSATGSITTYSVTVSPDTVAVGSTNVQIGWTVYNTGSKPIKEVDITYPSAAGWAYLSANGGGWTVSHTSPTVYFTAGTQIPVGGSKTFYITFSSIPVITSDTVYTFPVKIIDQSNNTATINTTVTETAYIITLTYSPVSPISADGTSKYTLTATLTKGGSPVSGVAVTFTTTAGTLSVVPPRTDFTTDSNGIAMAYLTSPCSTTTINATIAASYLNAIDQETVGFTGVAAGTLVYVGGSFRDNSSATQPPNVSSGSSVTLQLQLLNCGSTDLNITAGTLKFASYTPSLPSSVVILSGVTGTLTFYPPPVTVSGAFKCLPTLTVTASGYTGPFSTATSIGDYITVDSGTTCRTRVRILDWREVQ